MLLLNICSFIIAERYGENVREMWMFDGARAARGFQGLLRVGVSLGKGEGLGEGWMY